MTNPEKRSVSTDALETLGTIIEDGGRDAIHLAVEPVIAGETLYPGQHITAIDGIAWGKGPALGIVDPFLHGPAQKGQKFWLVVFPRKITSLRHVWSHPDFPETTACPGATRLTTQREESEQWIRNYAADLNIGYRKLMDGARDWLDSRACSGDRWGGEYLNDGPTLEGVSTHPDFWNHYEIVTGHRAPPEHRENFFTCSC